MIPDYVTPGRLSIACRINPTLRNALSTDRVALYAEHPLHIRPLSYLPAGSPMSIGASSNFCAFYQGSVT